MQPSYHCSRRQMASQAQNLMTVYMGVQHGCTVVCRRIIARPIFDSVRTEYHKIVTCSSSAHHTETRLPIAFSFMQDTTAPAA